MSLAITRALWTLCSSYVTQNYIYHGADKSLDQPKIMSGTRAISTKLRRELSESLFSARQGTEGNSRHSDRNISLFPSWSFKGLVSTPVNFQSLPRRKNSVSVIKTNQLMIYKEIIAVFCEIQAKHINTLSGQNVKLLNVKLAVSIVTTGT